MSGSTDTILMPGQYWPPECAVARSIVSLQHHIRSTKLTRDHRRDSAPPSKASKLANQNELKRSFM